MVARIATGEVEEKLQPPTGQGPEWRVSKVIKMSDMKSKQKEIDANFEFFQKKLPEILEHHRGKYALIRNREIVGYYDTAVDAQLSGSQLFKDEVFSIQQVTDKSVDLGFYSHAVHLGAA
jgi:hypothetical protein